MSTQDPDYEIIIPESNDRLAVFQRGAQEAAVRRIDAILQTQFENEISLKENELDSIDQRLLEGRAMLDHLRACAVAKYYATVYQIIESDNSADNASVHPAVKKYIGKTVPNLVQQKSQQDKPEQPQPTKQVDAGQPKNEILIQPPAVTESVTGIPRLKSKFCFVVGNVSKFILPDSRLEANDQATHKWMVYVRGGKEHPDVSHLVKKVVFFLHPSYRPNDLVAVTNPPFHLARRGWGEFPVRVQIHFQDVRNKPLDVIHNLKLDKTFTGLQTLGAETVAHVMLLTTPDQLAVHTKSVEIPNCLHVQNATKSNAVLAKKSEIKDAGTAKQNLASVPQTFNSKNPAKRTLLFDDSSESPKKIIKTTGNSCLKQENFSILKQKSDGPVEHTNNVKSNGPLAKEALKVSIQAPSISAENKNDGVPKERIFQLLLQDGKLINVKIQPGVLLNSLNSAMKKNANKVNETPQISNEQKANVEIVNNSREEVRMEVFRTIDDAMFQLVKRFPLQHSKFSWTNFLAWPFGKQRAIEWQRAKKIQVFLQKTLEKGKHPVLGVKDVWTTKAIFLWCRKYGFTPIDANMFSRLYPKDTSLEPLQSCGLNQAQDLISELEKSCCFNAVKVTKEEDTFVDVVSLDLPETNSVAKHENIKTILPSSAKQLVCVESNSPFVDFVRSVASETGLKCAPEEIEPGMVAPMADMGLGAACKEFLHHLLHTAMSCRTSNGNPNTLTKDDLCRGILALPDAEFLTNRYLGSLAHKS